MTDRRFMERAIELARQGKGWTNPNPLVGAVIVKDGRVIGEGYHARCGEPHAERNAIAALTEPAEGADLYVTLEPCQMCSGAIVQSRMTRVVVGCMNPKAGCAGSILNLLQMPQFNHQVELTTGVLEEECSQMMKTFFKELREKRKKNKQ